MSPRRRIEPGADPLFVAPAAAPRTGRGWWPLYFALVALVAAGGIAVAGVVLAVQQTHQSQRAEDGAVLSGVGYFMTMFTSPDPFHANDYVDRVLQHATGEFAKQYQEKANLALLQVARSEPTTGTVLELGVERWNDDGSANVLAVTNVSTTTPDGKNVVDQRMRWLVTAKKEGVEWKISSLVQVI